MTEFEECDFRTSRNLTMNCEGAKCPLTLPFADPCNTRGEVTVQYLKCKIRIF